MSNKNFNLSFYEKLIKSNIKLTLICLMVSLFFLPIDIKAQCAQYVKFNPLNLPSNVGSCVVGPVTYQNSLYPELSLTMSGGNFLVTDSTYISSGANFYIGQQNYPNSTCSSSNTITLEFSQSVQNIGFSVFGDTESNSGLYTVTASGGGEVQQKQALLRNIQPDTADFSFKGPLKTITITASHPPTNVIYFYVNVNFLTFDYCPPVVPKINSVVLEKINSSLDANPNAGGGLRIFPDKDSPNDMLDKRVVRVKALTRLGAGQTVYFKSFDLDDPSTDDLAIDRNFGDPNDNRGLPLEGELNNASAVTDANGVATVEFRVSRFAGDNYKVAASTDSAYLNNLRSQGIDLFNGTTKITEDNIAATAKTSPMVTVWRRVHVEVDSMNRVTGNYVTGLVVGSTPGQSGKVKATTLLLSVPSSPMQAGRFQNGRMVIDNISYKVVDNTPLSVQVEAAIAIKSQVTFILYDDDDFNSSNFETVKGKKVPKPIGDEGEQLTVALGFYSRFQNSDLVTNNPYAAAYIKPVYDGGGNLANNTTNIKFALNVPSNEVEITTQGELGLNTDLVGADDFWVVYLQFAYQGGENIDFDPDEEGAEAGITVTESSDAPIISPNDPVPVGGKISLIYEESTREANSIFFTSIVVPHEIGHQFGLDGDENNVMDIMGYSTTPTTAIFRAEHLNILRWRVHSPGNIN